MDKSNLLHFTKGDVYWASLPKLRDSVQGGTRPVVVVSSLAGNRTSDLVMIAPLTTKIKALSVNANIDFTVADKPSQVLCNQIQTLPKSSLFNYIGSMSLSDILKIEKAILCAFGIVSSTVSDAKSAKDALDKQREDREMLEKLIPNAREIIQQLQEILKRQDLPKQCKIPKIKTKKYIKRTPEEIELFKSEWVLPGNNRNEVAESFGFSSYNTAWQFYKAHKDK